MTSVNGSTGAVTISVTSLGAASSTHAHGNIQSGGTITADTAIASGQHLVITDSSNKVARSSLTFSTNTAQYLRNDGTWAEPTSGHTVGIDVPADAVFTDTTYTFYSGTNNFYVYSGSTTQTVSVTPSITNNITGTGTSGYLAKFNGTNTLTNGPALGTDTTQFLNNKGTWGTAVTQVTAGAGLTTTSGSSTDGGNITTSGTLYLTKTNSTTGSFGPTGTITGTNGTSINIPQITVDAYGRVTSAANRALTLSHEVTSVAGKTGTVTLGDLTIGNKTYNGSTAISVEIADLGMASVTQFLGMTDTDLSDGDSCAVHITVGTTTGTIAVANLNNGDIVMEESGDEFIWTGSQWNLMGLASSWALSQHMHGNILNNGTITSDTSATVGQHLAITDNSNQVARSNLTFSTATAEYLCHNGTWATPPDKNYVTLGEANRVAYYSDTATVTKTNKLITNGDYLHIENAAEASLFGTNENAPFYIGSPTGVHLVIDDNELFVKANETTGGTLYLQGSLTDIGGILVSGAAYNRFTNRIAVGEKTNVSVGATGAVINSVGNIHLGCTAGCGIYFYYGEATSTTGYIKEQDSGMIRLQNKLVINGATLTDVVTNGRTGSYTFFTYGAMGCSSNIWGVTLQSNLPGSTTAAAQNAFNSFVNGVDYGKWRTYRGFAASAGHADLILGNGTVAGSNGNSNGRIYLYGTSTASSAMNGAVGALGGTTRTYINFAYAKATQMWGAVWNDYAEMRKTVQGAKPGQCVKDLGDGSLELTKGRLERGAKVISDTYGFCIGQTEECQTPIAVTGRVLAYPYEDREILKDYIGWPVCSGPNGTISIMTEDEEEKYPSRIIGTISEIPDYEIWKAGNHDIQNEDDEGPIDIQVDGRIWIYVK